VRAGLPSLRSRRFVREFRRSLRRACERGEFRVVHYSIQRDHLHLVVEAAGKAALGRGMKSVSARLARAANRAFGRRGAVLDGRYHLRVLRTPREVRHALAYVLLNARKHWLARNGTPPPGRRSGATRGGSGAQLAARHRLAAARADRSGGGAGGAVSCGQSAGSDLEPRGREWVSPHRPVDFGRFLRVRREGLSHALRQEQS
jgi:REP element-mobilizing transposase RayT